MTENKNGLLSPTDVKEAKKFSLGIQSSALQQLILQRFHALTIINSISFAVAGIIISVKSDLIRNGRLAFFSAFLLILITMISLGRYLYLIREDIKTIYKKIEDLPNEDWNKPFNIKGFHIDLWPEILYIFFIISIILFGLSFYHT